MPVEGRGPGSGCSGRSRGEEIGRWPENSVDLRRLQKGLYGQAKRLEVSGRGRSSPCGVACRVVKPVREPDAGNPHVRFDERVRETEP